MRSVHLMSLCLFVVPLIGAAPCFGAATGSSDFKSNDRTDYSAASAADGKFETYWINGGGTSGKGEWMELDLPRGNVRMVRIATGVDGERRAKFSRATKVTLEVRKRLPESDTGELLKTWSVTLEDKAGFQDFPIEPMINLSDATFGGSVRITINEVVEGEDFIECATAEVEAVYSLIDAPAILLDVSSGSGSKTNLVDDNTKTAWTADSASDESFEVESPGWSMSRIGILPGHAGAWSTYARLKEVTISISGYEIKHTFDDKNTVQWVDLPLMAGIRAWPFGSVTVQANSVYPGKKEQLAISEVKLQALAFDGI